MPLTSDDESCRVKIVQLPKGVGYAGDATDAADGTEVLLVMSAESDDDEGGETFVLPRILPELLSSAGPGPLLLVLLALLAGWEK